MHRVANKSSGLMYRAKGTWKPPDPEIMKIEGASVTVRANRTMIRSATQPVSLSWASPPERRSTKLPHANQIAATGAQAVV